MRMELGKLGVWLSQEMLSAQAAQEQAWRMEALGYRTLWHPEAMGRDVMVHSALVLSHTNTLNLATGIANIYGRDPFTCANGQRALAEASGGRFLLGLGVSHVPLVEGVRHHTYGKPIETMRNYLSAMAQAPFMSVHPAQKPLTVLAALGPRMLALAAELADGAHPYNVTPEHTAGAREILGPGKLLCPEQMVLLETDAAKARAAARRSLAFYLPLPNYANNWLRLGFTTDDLAGGGSDRFIDAMVAWGDERAIRDRIQAHWDAGADHVCIQTLSTEESSGFPPADERLLAMLAPSQG
jgi:probable F420-dependent oxidoreductase